MKSNNKALEHSGTGKLSRITVKDAAQLLAFLIVLIGSTEIMAGGGGDEPQFVKFTILQMNDVYEIVRPAEQPLGGLARVASLRKRLLAENPATFTILSGDLLSPSPLNGVVIDGQPLAGRQMVSVLNTAGLDLATFGNHEFDVTREQFLQRLQESKFRWISSNALDPSGQPFPNVSRSHVVTVNGQNGASARIGFFGLTITSNRVSFVSYTDPIAAAAKQVEELRGQCDIVIAVTHLDINTDRIIADQVPGIHLIAGGHEHLHNYETRFRKGGSLPPIAKADSNVRTVYIHRLYFDPVSRVLEIRSQLHPVQGPQDPAPNSQPGGDNDDPATSRIAGRLTGLGYKALQVSSGLNPDDVVGATEFPLDGENLSIVNRQTNLAKLVGQAFLFQTKATKTQAALFNAGSIRIDDAIEAGSIRVIDVLRLLPFRARIFPTEIDGRLLIDLLDQGQRLRGKGGFLQAVGVDRTREGRWSIAGQVIDPAKGYRVVVNDYVLAGRESGYGDPAAPGSVNARLRALWDALPEATKVPSTNPAEELLDTRRALIDYLKDQGKVSIPLDAPLEPQVYPSAPVDHPPVTIRVDDGAAVPPTGSPQRP